jgi:hypothetical protein
MLEGGALPHNFSNPKKTMPQNKNLTHIKSADGGIGGPYGVIIECEKSVRHGTINHHENIRTVNVKV